MLQKKYSAFQTAAIVALALGASPAKAIEQIDKEAVQVFVEEVYPRVMSFNFDQDRDQLQDRVRMFATQEGFDAYMKKVDEEILGPVTSQKLIRSEEIVSKVSVYELGDGNWKAEFISRQKSLMTQENDKEDKACISVTVGLMELPASPGMSAGGITSMEWKPSKVKC